MVLPIAIPIPTYIQTQTWPCGVLSHSKQHQLQVQCSMEFTSHLKLRNEIFQQENFQKALLPGQVEFIPSAFEAYSVLTVVVY